MIVYPTVGTNTTIAGILALFVLTSQIVRTVRIGSTLWAIATHKRIAAITVQAVALCSMRACRSAKGILTALDALTGVDALFVDASLCGSTFRIATAADLMASKLTVTGVTVMADTNGMM